jgi:uncharacterized protein
VLVVLQQIGPRTQQQLRHWLQRRVELHAEFGFPGWSLHSGMRVRRLPLQHDMLAVSIERAAAAGGGALIRSAVGEILGTVGSSDFTQGKLPWRTEFGSLLHLLRHQKNDRVLQELARVYVVDVLKRWEPRVVVTSVQIAREQ